MDLGGFERLVETHLGENGRQTTRQHRLAGTRRAHHEDVMSAGRRDFERTLGVWLALHLRKIDVILCALGKQARDIDAGAGQIRLSLKKIGDFGETTRPQDPQSLHHARLSQILPRQNERLDACRPRRERHR